MPKWSAAAKIKALILFHHILLGIGLYFIKPHYIAVALVSYLFFGKIGGEVGLHRYFSHRSFKTSVLGEYFLLLCSIGNGLGSPLSWAATHRLHHRNEDREDDPHSPSFQRPLYVWLTLWKPFLIPSGIVSDLAKSRAHRYVHRYYFTIHIAMWIPVLLVDPIYLPFVFSFPCVYGFHLSGAVNVLCHSSGPRNIGWLNIFGLGDAYHLNHHLQPTSYRMNPVKGGIDFAGWLISRFFVQS